MSRPDQSNFEYLRGRLKHLQESEACALVRSEVESQVVRWRRGSEQMDGYVPHFKKHFSGGRWLKEGQEGGCLHGYDNRDRLLIADSVVWIHSEELCEEIRFDSHGLAILISLHRVGPSGLLDWSIFQRADGGGERVYRWSGTRLEGLENRYHKHSNYFPRTTPWDGRFREESFSLTTYEYGLDGEVERISEDWLLDGQPAKNPRVVYQRKKKGESVASLSKEVEAALLQAIPERLARVTLDSPAYCLFLQYCSSGWDLAPTLVVATEAHRGSVDEELVWAPGEVEAPALELEWPRWEESWRRLHQLMGGNFDPALKLLRKVAKTLNERGLQTVLRTTSDFIVTAADSSDGVEIDDDFRASVPSGRRLKR